MNLPHNKISEAAEIIMNHYRFNKLPGNAEVYYTISSLRERQNYLDKQEKLLQQKLISIGVKV